jgi:hypothetical protein
VPFDSLRGLYDSASGVVETTLLTSAFPVEIMELIPDVVVYRGIYTKNKNEYNVARNPSQGKSVPERPYRQIAVCALWHVGTGIIDEGQRCRQEGKYHPKCVRVVAIWIESAFAIGGPRPEYV